MNTMNVLRLHINSLSEREKIQFSAACGKSIGYLRKAISNHERLNPALCVTLERATCGAVTRRDLRPEDWHLIWPELAEREA